MDTRLDSPTIDELNFFAQRLSTLSTPETITLGAIFKERKERGDYNDGLMMKELINLTYGLENIMVAANVGNLIELGNFAIENDLHKNIEGLENANPNFLNIQKVGQEIKDIDGGLFYCGCYVVAGEYEYKEIYDGISLPNQEENIPSAIFSITLKDKTNNSAQNIIITLPNSQIDNVPSSLQNFEVIKFESAIPYINKDMFMQRMDINILNDIAVAFNQACEIDQIKAKAAMQGYQIEDLLEALDVIKNISDYQLAHYCNDENDFFKEYLLNNLDSRFDAKWLRDIPCEYTGMKFIKRIGAVVTDYGIVYKGKGQMFAPVSYDDADETQSESSDDELKESDDEQEQTVGGLLL